MDTIKDFLKEYPTHFRPMITLKDGFTMSVQASDTHYSIPRRIGEKFTHVEIGFPSEKEDLIMEYAETPETPTDTVYGYVPVEVVEEIIKKRGGFA